MYKLIDELIDELKNISSAHPYIVVNIMHEIMRLTYPTDPHVSSNFNIENAGPHQADKLKFAINNALKIIGHFKNIGSYNKVYPKNCSPISCKKTTSR